jgi:hypothetical protein
MNINRRAARLNTYVEVRFTANIKSGNVNKTLPLIQFLHPIFVVNIR